MDNHDCLTANMSKDDILLNEPDILHGLLEAGNFKEDQSYFKNIEIKRNDKILFTFKIRPLSADERDKCLKNATKKGKKYGYRKSSDDEVIPALFYSNLIYFATVEDDRKKVWDNKKALEHYNLLQGVDLIDTVLNAGEKERVCVLIEEISGFNYDVDEDIKN